MKKILDEINLHSWSPQEKKQFYQNLYDRRINISKMINCLSMQERTQRYQQLYEEQLCLYEQKDVSKYCKFPFDEFYSEGALIKLMQWEIDVQSSIDVAEWELDPDQIEGIDIGPCPIISKTGMWHYFNTFNYEVKIYGDEFLKFMGDSYDYSEENIDRLQKWLDSQQRTMLIEKQLGFTVKVHKVNNILGSGCYTDDEEGIMSALSHGDGDLFGL